MTTALLIGVVGAIMSAVIGTIWYSPGTPMGKWHMAALGWYELSSEAQAAKMAEMKPKMWKTYAVQMLLSFLSSFYIGFATTYTVQNGGPASAVYYYIVMIWIAFTVPIIGQNVLWGNTRGVLAWKRFFSDSLCNLITFSVVAFMATLLV